MLERALLDHARPSAGRRASRSPRFVYWLTAGAYAVLGSGRDGGAAAVGRGGAPARAGPVRLRPLGVRAGRGLARRPGAAPVGRVRRDRPDGAHRRDARALDDRRGVRASCAGWWGAAAARPLVRAGLDRRRPRRAHQGAGRTPHPARRGARVPRARGRPRARPGGRRGRSAVWALFLLVAAPWYAAMFWLHGWDYAARARGRDARPRPPARDRSRRDGALLPPRAAAWGSSPGARSCRKPSCAGLRQARARARQKPAGGGDRLRRRLARRGPACSSRWRRPGCRTTSCPLFPAAALLVAASWPARPSRLSRDPPRRDRDRPGRAPGRSVARVGPGRPPPRPRVPGRAPARPCPRARSWWRP